MEHMKELWAVSIPEDPNYESTIFTENGWEIGKVAGMLPGDDTGQLTAQAIVDLHNASLVDK